ncbi:ABC transporter permease [Streptomyces sp. NBC_00645]|uniref:ABC transporter permease n=1 Tax=Streptomyces sp. NBC_00645 TaxID=2975795 RepID=UPI00324D6794
MAQLLVRRPTLLPDRLRARLRTGGTVQRAMLFAGAVLTTLFVLTALLGPLLAPYGFAQLQNGEGLFGSQQAPSGAHPLGTTIAGYDVLSRTVWGARTALEIILAALLLSVIPGTVLGLASGYLGGRLDRLLVGLADALYAFPPLLLAIVMSIVISGGQSSLVGGSARRPARSPWPSYRSTSESYGPR